MTQESLSTQLVKADTNVRRLCEYFIARREWSYPAGAPQMARDLNSAAAAVRMRTEGLLVGSESPAAEPPGADIESLGPGTHEAMRLERFTSFLRDLDRWFAAQSGAPAEAEGITALREIEACMTALTALTSTPPEPEPQPVEAPQPAPAEDPVVRTPTSDGVPEQLVLDDTDEKPLVQDFQERQELTPYCESLADDFLEAWGVELSYYNRKKLLERILRWITSAPEGQVLVIKMKTIEKPYEPYPSYVSRDVLDGKEPPQAW